ncbi:major antigen-like isoform X1 [Micractinium conductrix]|uniref:Major antigen-like isoform X1 n=1 Tax=Micractinium conductrix TaxID=554055 RepID=A0A2P6VNC0_9CHLO|nr:major antigen-like isoform X1 [Micractinium conductrix]|eukprot:PSC75602.1 major antigen-like isoform X1 [Micractinium conductrix]
MRVQDATGSNFDLQQRCTAQQQQIAALRAELEATQQRATAAEARGSTAAEHAAALQQEVERRRSVHSDGVESVTRLQVVSQVQRQENEELRQHVRQLSEAWEQENAAVGRLQQQLREALGAAGSHKAAVEARLRQAEVEWQQQLAEARERAKQAEAELSSRCQMLSIEKVAHEQAANRATAEQRAAEARCEAAEARCRQLAAELGDASGAAAQVQAARQQAEAAAEAARSLRRQLLEREARCEELEGALRGEQERRHSQAARAATAEVAQAGLGSHVKATHARLQQLQDQLGAAKQEVQQLQARNDELHQAHLASSSGFEAQVSGLQSELAGVRAERDTLRQHYAKASADLDAHLAAAGQQRQRSAALQQAERELRSALEAQQAAAAEAGRQAAALQGHCQALEARTAQLEGELVEAKQRAAAAEDRLAKAGRPGAPSLQDVVGGLRQELQERDLQLMQMHEDVSRERQKVQELQKQVLDQAMELDEMQRDSSDTFALRQQVSAAQQAEAHLRKEVGQLRQQLGAASAAASGGSVDGDGGDFSPRGSVRSIGSAASPSRSVSRMGAVAALQARLDAACRDLSAAQEEIARLSADRDRLRDELDARDTEAMRLQGELSMLQRQMADEQNWLSPLPDPYG